MSTTDTLTGQDVFNVMSPEFSGPNDAARFNNAIAAAIQAGGGEVYAPPGTYVLNDIQIWNANDLALNLGSALVQLPDGLTNNTAGQLARGFYFANCTNVRVTGGVVDGNRANVNIDTAVDGVAFGLQFDGCTGFTVEGTVLRNFATDGVYIGGDDIANTCSNWELLQVTCDDNYRNGLSITAAKDGKVTGGAFNNSSGAVLRGPEAGIDLEANTGTTVQAVAIEGVTCVNNVRYGLVFTHCTGCQATGCSFEYSLAGTAVSYAIAWGPLATDCYAGDAMVTSSNDAHVALYFDQPQNCAGEARWMAKSSPVAPG